MNSMITHAETLEHLAERLEDLEKRISQLERHPAPVAEQQASLPAARPILAQTASTEIQSSAVLSTIGIALLGIAGAYLLRAVSGAGGLPRAIVALIATAYAIAWLIFAARVAPRNRLAGVLYAGTSVLILAPMLWEMCLRFQAMSAPVAAGVLAAYVLAVCVYARQPSRTAAFSVAYTGAALTAVALSIGTRSMALFTAVLLAMVLWDEIARFRNRPLAVAPAVLLATDVGLWALLFIYRMPPQTRAEYPYLSPLTVLLAGFLLFGIHAAGIAVLTYGRSRNLSAFDALQAMIALALTACGLFWLAPRFGQTAFGFVSLSLSAACYAAAFVRFRNAADPRNFRVFATWAAALLLLAIGLLDGDVRGSLILGGLAIAAVFIGVRLRSVALKAHGMIYLIIAAAASGLLSDGIHALTGQMAARPSPATVLMAMVAMAVYVFYDEQNQERALPQALHFIAVLLAAWSAAALLMLGLFALVTLAITPAVFHIALLRTLILCAVALAMAIGGRRLHRIQMIHAAYTFTALAAAKLFFEDLRHGQLAFIAASICLVALTLIAVPRIGNARSKARIS